MYLHSAEDPLENLGNKAIRVFLNTSCENTKYLDCKIFNYIIESIKDDRPVVSLSPNLQNLLKRATPRQLDSIVSGSLLTFSFLPRKPKDPEIPAELFQIYSMVHNYTVIKHGNEYATQVYGITYKESEKITAGFKFSHRLNLNYKRYTLKLRCSEDILIDLLREKDEERIASLKLIKAQQILSSELTLNPSCPTENYKSTYDLTLDAGKSNVDQAKKLLAREMLITGYTVGTVSIELGLSARQCRLIYENVRDSKFVDREEFRKNKTVSTRIASNYIKSKDDILNFSILMRAYLNIGGDSVKNSTHIRSLNLAYSLLCSIRHDVYGLSERKTRKATIQDAWNLAVDHRSNLGYFRSCRTCNSHFYCNDDQCRIGESCVFCDSDDVELMR